MLHLWKRVFVLAALLTAAPMTMGFSLLGPGGAEGVAAKMWQLPGQNQGWDIGYNQPGLDIGAPVNPLLEYYRWNIPMITYAYDDAFIKFFGTNGMKAVDAAIRILNELPAANRMSKDLNEFPLNPSHLNFEAAQLGLVDLKSTSLSLLLEHMGLADSVRWNFAIRQRTVPGPVYTVIKYNYDPITLRPSSYVNGTLWTYFLLEIPPPVMFADAAELLPAGMENQPPNIPVSSLSSFPTISGYYFTGLSRDDAGGLRYLYHPRNFAVENLLAGTLPGAGTTWLPVLGTNFIGNTNVTGTNIITATNTFATVGVRGGINKIQFVKVHFDSLLGSAFTSITNQYKDVVAGTNSQFLTQVVRRPILAPDIVFTVTDLLNAIADRTTTAGWTNNDALNGTSIVGGPGLIVPQVTISFNELLPQFINLTPFFVTEPFITDPIARSLGLLSPTWASFDGSTNEPIIYPVGFNYNINTLRQAASGGSP